MGKKFSRSERKAMLYAVTHGCKVVFLPKTSEREFRFVCDTPKKVKVLLAALYARCEYMVYARNGAPCVVSKGKVYYGVEVREPFKIAGIETVWTILVGLKKGKRVC